MDIEVGNATFIDSRMDVLAGWLGLCQACVYSNCANRLRRPPSLPRLPASRLLLLIFFHPLPRMLSLIHCHQTHTRHAYCFSFKTLPIIIPQPLQRSLCRTPQIRQIRHISMRSLMPNIDEQSRQADFLRLCVHGDFVFRFLLRVEEAGYESAPVNLPASEFREFGVGEGLTEISP